jgi:hypothetical protein
MGLALQAMVLLGSFSVATAQFDITPTDSLVDVFGVDSITRIFQVDFPNTSGDSLGLSWRWIDGGWTEGWDVNLCDLGECYTGVPADADMLPMGPEGAGFLKLIVNALELEGSCFLHFWVWPTGNQDALVHVFFDLRNETAMGQSEHTGAPCSGISAYPVPCMIGRPVSVRGLIDTGLEGQMQLFDAQGTLIPCRMNGDVGEWRLETAHLVPGIYLLKYDDNRPPLRLLME